jgi:hypothetical protein
VVLELQVKDLLVVMVFLAVEVEAVVELLLLDLLLLLVMVELAEQV